MDDSTQKICQFRSITRNRHVNMAVLVRSIYVIFGHDKRFFQDMDNISILLSLELPFTPVCRHISMCKKMLLFVTALKFTQIYRYVHIEYFQFSQCFFCVFVSFDLP